MFFIRPTWRVLLSCSYFPQDIDSRVNNSTMLRRPTNTERVQMRKELGMIYGVHADAGVTNIIVNFAIAALLKCAGRWVHRANARIMGVARVYLRLSSSAGESYIFASRHPDTRRVEGRNATPKMRKEWAVVSTMFRSRRLKKVSNHHYRNNRKVITMGVIVNLENWDFTLVK